MSNTLMLFGLGNLGGWALEFLTRSSGVSNIITCDARKEWGYMKTECAAIGAGHLGYSKKIEFENCDVNNIDQTAELLKKYNPDVIYSAMILSGPADMRFVSHAVGLRYDRAGVCMTSAQITPICKLMKARKEAGIAAPVVNNSYPDIVNPVLWRNGLGPLIGAGNIDIAVGEIRRKVSITENVPLNEVIVYLLAPHAIDVLGTRTGVTHFVKILIGDKDITNNLDVDSLMSDTLLITAPPDQSLFINQPHMASSAVKNIIAILNDTNEFTHAPGPTGLPGGYPVRISAKGVEIVLPEGITIEEAIKINLDGLKFEGLEEIKDDGTVVLTDEAYEIQKELYGIDCRELPFVDMEEIGKEIIAASKKLAAKYK